jgi:hypothetical protein
MLATVAESFPTRFFLANPAMNSEAYSKVFHLNGAETREIRSLIPKKELLLKQWDYAKILRLNVDPKSFWLYTSNPHDNQRKEEVFRQFAFKEGLELLAKEKSR